MQRTRARSRMWQKRALNELNVSTAQPITVRAFSISHMIKHGGNRIISRSAQLDVFSETSLPIHPRVRCLLRATRESNTVGNNRRREAECMSRSERFSKDNFPIEDAREGEKGLFVSDLLELHLQSSKNVYAFAIKITNL